MAQQTHERTQGMNNAWAHPMSAIGRRGDSLRRATLGFLLAALFCLPLSRSVPAQDSATKFSAQVIKSAVTLKCGDDEFKLVVVRANMPAQPTAETTGRASALGVALVPAGTGDIKIFARYWFFYKNRPGDSVEQQLLRRDNDTGELGTKLFSFDEHLFGGNVNKFFKDCADDKARTAVIQALSQANPQASIEEVQTAFRNAGLELDPNGLTTELKNIDEPSFVDDAGQVLFAETMHESLRRQLGKETSAAVEPSPAAAHSSDAGALAGELKTIKDRLEENRKLTAALSTLVRILLGVSATFLAAALFFAVLFYFNPALQHKFFLRPEDATEIRRQTIDEFYRGLQKISDSSAARRDLEEILDESEKRLAEADGDLGKTKAAYGELQRLLKQFSLSLPAEKNGGNTKVDADIIAVRQFISDSFGITFADADVSKGLADLTAVLEENLRLLVSDDSEHPLRILTRLEAARRQIEAMWSEGSSEPCPEGALTLLAQSWKSIHDALEPLGQTDHEQRLARTREAVALFGYMHEKFPRRSDEPNGLKSKVERFFGDLDAIQSMHMTDDARSDSTPEDILIGLDGKLSSYKQTSTDFKNLSNAVRTLQQELPASSGTDSIAQATQMAKSHRKVLELLKEYRPSDDCDNIVKTVRSVQTKLHSASLSISKLLPGISGTIDVMVKGLAEEFGSKVSLAARAEEFKGQVESLQGELEGSKAQAKESTGLASALSCYVNLSVEEVSEPDRVAEIFRRFSSGERTHRQLRLRLSAATSALDQAIEEVRREGREDALIALRVGDFHERLWKLLTNMEDFRGDAMWRECLSAGFSEQWLHNLLRAELLARTYFTQGGALSRLSDPLTEASTALRMTLSDFDVRVPFIDLLSKPTAGARVDYEVDPKLNRLQEVRRKVQAMLREQSKVEDGFNFIVDVGSFPFQSGSAESFGGRVIVVSPSEWA